LLRSIRQMRHLQARIAAQQHRAGDCCRAVTPANAVDCGVDQEGVGAGIEGQLQLLGTAAVNIGDVEPHQRQATLDDERAGATKQFTRPRQPRVRSRRWRAAKCASGWRG